jgi:hypothetical protein
LWWVVHRWLEAWRPTHRNPSALVGLFELLVVEAFDESQLQKMNFAQSDAPEVLDVRRPACSGREKKGINRMHKNKIFV